MNNDKRPCFYREDGKKVYIQAVSLVQLNEARNGVVEHFREEGLPVDPPTYFEEAAGGDRIELPLTEELLEVEGNDEESQRRKLAWEAHQSALAKIAEKQREVAEKIFFEGILLEGFRDIDAWAKEMEKEYFIHVPKDAKERRIKFIKMEVLKTPKDTVVSQNEITILSASGQIDRAKLEAAQEAFFRGLHYEPPQPQGESETVEGEGQGA